MKTRSIIRMVTAALAAGVAVLGMLSTVCAAGVSEEQIPEEKPAYAVCRGLLPNRLTVKR